MNQLYRVLYCSRNQIVGDPEAVTKSVTDILAASRENNLRDGVTGGLLFSDGCFAQVLEGTVDSVQRTFERIQCDVRHGEVTVLQAGPISARDFPDWSMGFTGAIATASRFTDLPLENAFSGLSDEGNALLSLLKGVIVRETEWLAPVPTIAQDA